jgi:putative ABC transport system substrate-binding protein
MRRREFIAGLAGSAAWPLAARAQQPERVRRIGMLAGGVKTDLTNQARQGSLRQGLAKLGWIEGRNVRFDLRFSGGDPVRLRAQAEELVGLAPDVIVVTSGPAAQTLLQRTRTIPIIFTTLGDPVAIGLLKNIAHPEGNITGITNQHQSLGGKWLELLKEAAPRTARVALIFVPEMVNDQYFAAMDAVAEVLAVKAMRTPYRNATELERAIDTFAAEPNGGLVIMPPSTTGSTQAASCHELRQKVELVEQLIVEFTSSLVCGEFLLAFRGDFQRIPPYYDGSRLLGLIKPKQKVGKADNRSRAPAVLAADCLRESVIGAMGE